MMIDNYRPYNVDLSHWNEIAPFVRTAVRKAFPQDKAEAASLMRLARGYASWVTEELGMELTDSVFKTALVARYAELTFSDHAIGRRQQQRLFLISSAVLGTRRKPATIPNYAQAASPYSKHEGAMHDSWAAGLRQEWRRRDAAVFIALGRGAGLDSPEMLALRLTDMKIVDGVMLLTIWGAAPRTVPVFAEQAAALLATLAEFPVPEFFLSSHTRGQRELSGAFSHQPGVDRPSSPRLRATWIVRHLNARSPLKEFLAAAGLSSTATLSRYLPYVTEQPDAVRLLAGFEVSR